MDNDRLSVLKKVKPNLPESAQSQVFDVLTDLRTQEVTGLGPVVSVNCL